jgi:hypothetical protein
MADQVDIKVSDLPLCGGRTQLEAKPRKRVSTGSSWTSQQGILFYGGSFEDRRK